MEQVVADIILMVPLIVIFMMAYVLLHGSGHGKDE